jgi:hypothetical protein
VKETIDFLELVKPFKGRKFMGSPGFEPGITRTPSAYLNQIRPRPL